MATFVAHTAAMSVAERGWELARTKDMKVMSDATAAAGETEVHGSLGVGLGLGLGLGLGFGVHGSLGVGGLSGSKWFLCPDLDLKHASKHNPGCGL